MDKEKERVAIAKKKEAAAAAAAQKEQESKQYCPHSVQVDLVKGKQVRQFLKKL